MTSEPVPPGTQVTFLDQTEGRSVDAMIAHSVPVKRIVANVVAKLNLPLLGPDGHPVSYSLDHREGGKRLLEEQTLPEAGVHNGDHLIIYPEMIAGRPGTVVESGSIQAGVLQSSRKSDRE